jgi:glutaredoxin|tara:strand:- start:1368 stop:1610 length:243 start_codon:yes stop_codon:yes gene_type:complete
MITIYASNDCIWCIRAKQLAEIFELEHEYKLVENYRAEFSSKFPDAEAVPQIVWDGVHFSGYQAFAQRVNEFINDGEKND